MRAHRWQLTAGLLLAGLLGLGGWVWWSASPAPVPTPDSDGKTNGRPASETKPLTIRLHVLRLVPEGRNLRRLGELGDKTYGARLNDRVEVEATLSEPAYAYLIAFNPAEKPENREQLLPSSAAERTPEKGERLAPASRLKLDDGEGLQALAVVASRQRLPAYAQWRKTRPPLLWEKTRATSGVVWVADGAFVDGVFEPGFQRATEEKAGDKALIRELARQLKAMPDFEAVSVVGFAVDRAE
jgi:hypothetical protein